MAGGAVSNGGGSGPAPDRQDPANARNSTNPRRLTGQAAGVRIAAVPIDAGAPAHDAANVGVGARNSGVAPAGGVGAHNAVIGGAPPRAGHANGAGGAAMALAALGVGGNAVAPAQAGAGVIANGGGAPAGQSPVHPYFDLDAGLSGPPLRRSEVGPFF